MNKKKIITIALASIIVLVISASVFGIIHKKNQKSVASDLNVQSEELDKEKVEDKEIDTGYEEKDKEEKMEIIEENNSSILTFTKDTGVLSLYNTKGKLVDFVDLKIFNSSGEKNKNLTSLNDSNETEEEIEEVKINNEKIIKEIEEKLAGEIDNEDRLTLEGILEKYSEANEAIEINEELIDNEEGLDLEEDIEIGYETFRTINNDLIFKDAENNLLIQVNIKDEKILVELLLKDVALKGLTSVDVTEEDIYLTLKGSLNIIKIAKGKSTNGKLQVEKYELESNPYFVIHEDGYLYYFTQDELGKINTENESNEKVSIEMGDSISSAYVEGDYLFIISEFGKLQNNSVLMKINKESLRVANIMELKGINSVFIGSNEESAYIRQKDSIKEVDLKSFKPKTTHEREEGIPVQIKGSYMYRLKDGNLEIFDLETNKKKDFFEVDGFTFQVFN